MSNSNDGTYKQNIADAVYSALTSSSAVSGKNAQVVPINPALASEHAYAAFQIDSELDEVPTVVVSLS